MRWIIRLLLLGLVLWGATFGLFLGGMYVPPSAYEPTDALIVLTGGNARVERGFTLLAEQAAPVLFISGVGKQVTQSEMLLAHTTAGTRRAILARGSEIVFDYKASSTQTNASEAAQFVRERGYKTIRLVTAHYHMPRSLLEFHAALPGVRILREPVEPQSFAERPWWNDEAGRRLIWQEFHKFIAAGLRILFDKM